MPLDADDLAAHLMVWHRQQAAFTAAVWAARLTVHACCHQEPAGEPGSGTLRNDLLLLGFDCEGDAAECAAVADARYSYGASDNELLAAAADADAAAEHLSSGPQQQDGLVGEAVGSGEQQQLQARRYFKSPCNQQPAAATSPVVYKNAANAPAWTAVRRCALVAHALPSSMMRVLTHRCAAAGGHITCQQPAARHGAGHCHGAVRACHLPCSCRQQLVVLCA